MNIDYTVTALMFPAIPLLMGVYSNRFHTLSRLIRELHDEHVYEKHIPAEWKKQFINLSRRISILRWTIMFAAFGFLFNMLTVFALYLNELLLARVIFGSCCLSMIISIIFFIREIQISTNALNLHMSDMDVKID
jgi:MFS family permease